jgi:O-antigen/teichoic acid export membrane protein
MNSPSSTAMAGLTQRTVAGFAWMASGKAAHRVVQLLVLGILGRLLTPAEFGVVSAALVTIAFSNIVSQLGLGPAIVQRAELERRHIGTAFWRLGRPGDSARGYALGRGAVGGKLLQHRRG